MFLLKKKKEKRERKTKCDSQLIWPETTRTHCLFIFKFRVYVPVAELVANCCETGSGGWTTSEPCVVPFRSTKHSDDERRQSVDEKKKKNTRKGEKRRTRRGRRRKTRRNKKNKQTKKNKKKNVSDKER